MTTRRKALRLISAGAAAGMMPWPGQVFAAGQISVSIRVTLPPLAVAPAGVFLEAIVEDRAARQSVHGAFSSQYLPAFHEFHYRWSLPDAGPVRAPAHLVDAHRRTDRAEGPFMARVFATPGRHRVAVEVTAPDGRTGQAEAIVDVADPEAAFSAESTIVVSANGDFTGAPAHSARNAVIDLEAAMARYNALDVPQVRILLRRGQDYSGPRKAFALKAQRAHCLIGAWGTGAAPRIDLRARGGTFMTVAKAWSGRSLVLSDLHFQGGWDPTTELWQGGAHKSIVRLDGESALLLHACREDGCAATINARRIKAPRPGGTMIFVNEHIKTDFKDYLLLCPREQADVAITGSQVVQHPQALNGAQARGKTSEAAYGRNAHNFFRGSARRLYIASNDIFVRHGWSTGTLYDNHALRLNRNNVRGMRAVIARNHIEGMLAQQAKKGAVPINMLIEQNYIVANPMTRPAFVFLGGATTLRNNIVLEHDTPRQPGGGSGFKGFVGLNWDGRNKAAGRMPVLIYHNSFILLRRKARTEILDQDGQALSHVYLGNNLLWAPELAQDPTGHGPLDRASLGWDARYRGARLGWAGLEKQNLPQTLLPGDRFTVPYWNDMFGQRLSQADFAGQAGRHVIEIRIKGKRQAFDAQKGEAKFDFLSEGVRVTNQTPLRWPEGAGFRLHCDRGATPTAMQTAYAHPPGTISLYRPLPAAGAWRSADLKLRALHDFLGERRSDTPSRGAVEPG